jgi:hypothetical protein
MNILRFIICAILVNFSKDPKILTMGIEFPETDEVKPSAVDVLIGAYDIISRIYSQRGVIEAYYLTDPESMSVRK